MKLHELTPNHMIFECPGCGCAHGVRVNGERNEAGGSWGWNGSMEKPTFTPSVLSQETIRCHSFVKNGRIQFLTDCEHELAGQTVELPEWEE